MTTQMTPAMNNQDPGLRAAAAVDPARIAHRLAELAAIGATGDGGVNRQVFSPEDRQARAYLVDWARSLGLGVQTDPIGNQFFRLTPPGGSETSPAWMTGSHLDSQPTGGRFDGVFGVVAALEAITALVEAKVPLTDAVEAVSWSNEEGSRFSPGCMGSMTYVGRTRLEDFQWAVDGEGTRLTDELFATLASTPRGKARAFGTPVRGYLELHIEQGPVLEREALPVAVVEGIQGCRWFTVEVRGAPRHAGTTPMHLRADAVREATSAITALYDGLDDPQGVLKVTVGKLVAEPGSPNTVAGRVVFTIDLRHPDEASLIRAEAMLNTVITKAMQRCQCEVTRIMAHRPTAFDPGLRGTLGQVVADLGLPPRQLMSGAFHDAMHMADFCPTAMLFVPSRGGISHHPDEFTDLADLTTGTRVLAASLARLAGAPV